MKTLSITPSQLERMTEQELYQQHIQPWMPVLDRQSLQNILTDHNMIEQFN